MADRYSNLFSEIRKCKPKSILEIGTYNGQHAVQMIQMAQRFQGTRVSYFGFDLFEDITPETITKEHSKEKGYLQKDVVRTKLEKTFAGINLFKGFTSETLPKFVEWVYKNKVKSIDFVFIDGGHSIETIKNDWLNVDKIIHNESVILFDDYYYDRDDLGCKNLIDSLDKTKFNIEFLKPVDVFQKENWLQKTQIVKVTKILNKGI